MKSGSSSLDKWRKYFRTANSNIFDIIEHAIIVAASDCPKEFRLRRHQIAEALFSCKMTRCSGCNQVELGVPEYGVSEFEAQGSKDSKVNSSVDNLEMNVNQHSNYSFGEAEALTNEIEEESQIVDEVLRIKTIIENSKDESDSVLFDSLRRLQLMDLSVETLQATEIGKAVKFLRKHSSKEIQKLARTLIEEWIARVDEWFNASTNIAAEATPESVNPSGIDEEEGLPSPPLDDIAFFSTPMELSQFFDGMDDDGNPRNGGESNKDPNCHQLKRPVPNEMKKQGTILKSKKPSNFDLGPGRPIKSSVVDQKGKNENSVIQEHDKQFASQRDKSSCSGEFAEQEKLEATKRKLHELYQKAENAKKRRTIQVMEVKDLPKQGLGPKNRQQKPVNKQNRPWLNGRR